MRKLLIPLLFFLFLSGCSLGVKQRWTDFNAYYNTFYNAKNSYREGERLIEAQNVTINPERPIRIHRTPARAGQAQFEKAIEKSADILRNHDDSKWVDDALELIGKSYFQLGQFFAAEQKFNEILVTSVSQTVRQRAVLWKSLIFLETNRNNEGIQYINNALLTEEYDWNPQILSEIYLILGQLHVALEDWDQATQALAVGLPDFRDDILRTRGYFLKGQLLERQDRLDEALVSYGNISTRYPEYNLIFDATVRQAALRRELGQFDRAYRDFTAMSRDDKNFDQIGDLTYEMGRTLQLKGEATQSFQLFQQVLYNSLRPPTRETIAKTHYAIAELYRFDFADFNIAAAYYDSSSRNATDLTRLPLQFDAAALAASFRNYSRLSQGIAEKDSLLALGLLPRDEFEQTIIRIRDERLREFQRQARQDQLRGTTLVNVTPGQDTAETGSSGDNGFLNYRNPNLVNQSSQSFAALWDGRPLVDNWRRLQAVRQSVASVADASDQDMLDANAVGEIPIGLPNVAIPAELNIDLSVIPFTVADQNRMRGQIADLSYELGNVFYLNLNMPDSALIHYLRVVEEFQESLVLPQAMYTVADIYLSEQDTTTALTWATAIVERFPSSAVATRIASRLNLDVDLQSEVISDEESARLDYLQLLDRLPSLAASESIASLDHYLIRHPSATNVAQALFAKAMLYAQVGRQDSSFSERLTRLQDAQQVWSDTLMSFQQQQADARLALQDSTLSDDLRVGYQSLSDSVLVQPNLDILFPYVGAAWDSTRSVLTHIATNFGSSGVMNRVQSLQQVISVPEALQPVTESAEEMETPDLPDTFIAEFIGCDLLDEPVQLANGLDSFLSDTGFRDLLAEQNILSADFEFEITLSHTGAVEQVDILSDVDPMGLTEQLRVRLRTQAVFKAPLSNAIPVRTACYFAVRIEP